VPCVYDGSSLNGPDALEGGPSRTRPGAPCVDAPLGKDFLLDKLGNAFQLLAIDTEVPDSVEDGGIAAKALRVSAADDPSGDLAARYLGEAKSAVYLLRPDQHVAARWPSYDEAAVKAAIRTATGRA
jgi:3-(3-hydroxy-phenyl)propionate hydroxylase